MSPLRPRQNRLSGEAGKPPALAPASLTPEPEASGDAAPAAPPEGGGDVN
jgi:hypothetical protein